MNSDVLFVNKPAACETEANPAPPSPGKDCEETRMKPSSFTRRELLAGAGTLAALPAGGADANSVAPADLQEGFRTPPDQAKPWVYWWWLNGNVTGKSITRDLEEMRRKGVGGFLLFDSRGYHDYHLPPPPPRTEFMSDEWRRMVKFAISEAGRLGLQMSANLSTNGGALSSPWPAGADAPKKLVWTSAAVRGPRRVSCRLLPPGKPHFWEVAVLAVRLQASSGAAAAGEVDLSGEWREVAVADPKGAAVTARDIVDLTGRVDAGGRLSWDAPAGDWTILRFGCTAIEGHENDVDILNAAAAERHFERMGRKYLADAGPLAGKTLTYLYNVSWEGASPTWTPGFERDFAGYRGYDIRPFLAVLAGINVESGEASGRFLEDYSRTLSDCFLNHCYGKLGDLCHRAGLKWHSESGGPWNRTRPLLAQADDLMFWSRNDMPQGEFWHPGADASNCRRTAMAAHVYGRPVAAAEAFTNMVQHWSECPAVLKPRGDAAYIDGINHFIWHTFDASPQEYGKPGIVYWAGSHLNPNVTWWEHAGAFLTYLARCQLLLRQGLFVSDVCVYTSNRNSAPMRSGRSQRWSQKASLSLGKGYTYDLVNSEVVLERMSVRNGGLALPDGMRYRILVLDLEEDVMPPEVLGKMVELVEAGATVVLGRLRPRRAPGLKDAAERDAEVRRLAGRLWGDTGDGASRRALGKGKVYAGTSLDEVLRADGVLPDVASPFEYNHRRAGAMDIYFVTGQGQADCTFRVSGKEPEFWDPVTGLVRDAVWYRATGDGRTTVPIRLPENGSRFVVFRRPAATRHVVSITGPADGVEIAGRTRQGAQVRVWRAGSSTVETSAGRKAKLEAKPPAPLVLGGPWEVRFAPGWGAPESIRFERLMPWNEHPEEGIRYFSGTAVYRKTFDLDAARAGRPLRLRLGQVKNIARVSVNGKSLGVVWTDPWSADLTGAVQAGRNDLEIEVTNLWVNRLVGDAARPEEKRLTKTIVRRHPEDKSLRMPHLRGYLATDPLQPSGLIGPVEVEFGEVREVRL
jgi:hypothetical protein